MTSITSEPTVVARFLGATSSLLLHLLLLVPVLWGAPQAAMLERTPIPPAGQSSADEDYMTVMFVSQGDLQKENEVAASSIPVLAKISSPDIPSAPDVSSDDTRDETAPAGQKGHDANSILYGRYVGQMVARIDRAWIRPRAPLPDGARHFRCRLWVTQDARGNVEDLALDRCNGDARWQQSLMIAIRSASPLPAPPDPEVFRETLSLAFDSEPYLPGGSPDGFEPASQAAAVQSLDTVFTRAQKTSKEEPGVIQLRIIGTPHPRAASPANLPTDTNVQSPEDPGIRQ